MMQVGSIPRWTSSCVIRLGNYPEVAVWGLIPKALGYKPKI